MLQVPSGRAQVPSQVARVCCDEGCIGQGQPAPTTQSNATRQRGELVVDDVVVLEVLLKLIDIINLHHQAQAFADEA